MSQAAKKLIPLLDRVLVERAVAATKTSGGILLPETVGSKVRFFGFSLLLVVVDFFFFLLFFSLRLPLSRRRRFRRPLLSYLLRASASRAASVLEGGINLSRSNETNGTVLLLCARLTNAIFLNSSLAMFFSSKYTAQRRRSSCRRTGTTESHGRENHSKRYVTIFDHYITRLTHHTRRRQSRR